MRWSSALFSLSCALLAGCTGDIGEGGEEVAPAAAPGAPAGSPAPAGAAPGTPPGAPPPAAAAACTGKDQPHSRTLRLTNVQYRNTVQELLFLEAKDLAVTAELVDDPTDTGFDTQADVLKASDQHLRRYQTAAEDLAGRAVSNSRVLARLAPCHPGPDPVGCARRLVTDLGRRAFRRPLAPEELQAYVTLHGRAGALYPGGDAFVNGAALVIQAMLQAPDFLYRIEAGDPNAEGLAPLSGFEMAARLSYTLWGSMPDEPLFTAAADGRLRAAADVRAQARRMLDDPRARETVLSFHRQWLGADKFADFTRDVRKFPAFTAAMGVDLARELDRFVEYVAFEKNEALRTLLLSNVTHASRTLAKVYGLPGTFTNELQRVELDPARRLGVLGQAGFLASNAHFDGTDPIGRGVFVHRRLLCTDIPSPPEGIDQKLPEFSASVRTTRDRLDALTAPAQCTACHRIINPAGYAFERFDAVGAWRDDERGFPVDSSGAVAVDGRTASFEGAVAFIRQIADSAAARRCYSTFWLRFAYGRVESEADRCTVERLSAALAAPGFSTKDLLAELTQTRAFLNHIAAR